jgi:hypothetical protein
LEMAGKMLQLQSKITAVRHRRIDLGEFDNHPAESINISLDDSCNNID